MLIIEKWIIIIIQIFKNNIKTILYIQEKKNTEQKIRIMDQVLR